VRCRSLLVREHRGESGHPAATRSDGLPHDGRSALGLQRRNSPTFIVWNGSLTAFKPVCPSHPHVAAYLEYEGNGLAGTGYDGISGSRGKVEGTATTLLLIPDWPVAGRQVYVWADLRPTWRT